MNLSKAGYDLITSFEGYLKAQPDGSCKAYKCPAGVWTAGFGCTEGVGPDTHWTREQADEAFKRELAKHEKIVSRLVTVDMTQGQFDSLVSFSYNCGGLAKSTLLKKLNKGDYDGAANEFRYWTKANDPKTGKRVELRGLVRRRKAESAMFVSDMPGADDMPQAAEEKRPIAVQAAENLKSIIAVATAGAGTATVATQKAEAPQAPKPTTKEQVAKAKEQAKEIRETVEVAKDYATWGKGIAVAAYEQWMLVVPLTLVAAAAILWPKLKERF